MSKQIRGPMPRVTYDGDTYCLTSRKTVIPDFTKMSRTSVLFWILRNTRPRGYSKPNPLAGFAGAITVNGG